MQQLIFGKNIGLPKSFRSLSPNIRVAELTAMS